MRESIQGQGETNNCPLSVWKPEASLRVAKWCLAPDLSWEKLALA